MEDGGLTVEGMNMYNQQKSSGQGIQNILPNKPQRKHMKLVASGL